MINNEFLRDLSSRLAGLMPLAKGVKEDVEKNIHKTLQSAFAQLNLVTREDFDAQVKVLERAQQTIAELEAKVARLEQEGGLNKPGEENAGR